MLCQYNTINGIDIVKTLCNTKSIYACSDEATPCFLDLFYNDSLNQSSFYTTFGNFNWMDAWAECQQLGGRLPWIMTKDGAEVLMNHYSEEMWIGLKDGRT